MTANSPGRLVIAAIAVAFLVLPGLAGADHIGGHATPCNLAVTAGGGALGLSPGPVGPPNSLGWDVGSGQCNGSFSATSTAGFPGGALELALRAEQRRIGQVGLTGANDYTVQTGPDVGPPAANNRAWWNFQGSIAYNGSIAGLDSLTLEIATDVGPNLPASPVTDLLAIRGIIDDRNNQANATTLFADLYQFSQNPEFGWFAPTSDTDPNPTGAFDYDAPGAWRFILTAVEGSSSSSVSVCIHTPGEACAPPVTPRGLKEASVTTLQDLLPTGDQKADKRIEKAIERIQKSLTPGWWIDDKTLDPKDGKKVFDEEKKAVYELTKKEVEDNPTAQAVVQALLDADAMLALEAIDAAVLAGGDQKNIDKAYDEMQEALDEIADGDFDKAVEHFRKAWQEAQKAVK